MDTEQKQVHLIFNNTKTQIMIDKQDSFNDFIYKILNTIDTSNFNNKTDKPEYNEYMEFMSNHYITWVSKPVNSVTWNMIKDNIKDRESVVINIRTRLNGGFISISDIIDGLLTPLKPITDPIMMITNTIISLAILIGDLLELMYHVLEMIPIIFDPPKLVDDILFAITNSISTVTDYFMKSTDAEKPKEEPSESGPFGVNKRDNNKTCIPPTMATLIMLVMCPPLSIFYKFSFWEGIIPAIVCGILCVKLYYFPGLLFASLMVLC